ncbi:thioesterase II family protein [Phycicoccus flavus]|uniref:thioesterase II family protein n=1 Tax=Phycicoccus flavus TaxID=2502783 RepID=UPI000FEBD6AD|nr:alpha/beta fold hydrolase [Phycicoccus flavus]NHA67702.1 thioesterase [Phycicoccus flavus]
MTPVDLVCLPFAGAHMDPFHALRRECESAVPGLASMTVTYPGHGGRVHGALAPTILEMAHDALGEIDEHRARRGSGHRETVLLGYSMGGYVAYELAHLLADRGEPPVRLLAMAATPPAHLDGTDLDLGTDDELLEHCAQYGLVSPGSFPEGTMRRLFLPALRNDILAVDRYPTARGRRPLPAATELVVFTGAHDATVAHQDRWADLTAAPPRTHVYDGGHFFVTECRDALVRDVVAHLGTHRERTAA